MWQGFTIALREGIEAFLIVALTLSYLKRTGRAALARAVYSATAVSVVTCFGAGLLFERAAKQSLWEGVLALAAAVLVGSLLVYMKRVSSRLKKDIENRLETSASRGTAAGAFWGVFAFVLLMITREGMETALLVVTAFFQMRSSAVALGLALGLIAAAGIGFLWTRLGRGVDVRALLNVSAVFLAIFLVQLLLYGVHELSEAGVFPASRTIHDATEILGPDGKIGHLLAYLLAAIPTAWLAAVWWRRRERRRNAEVARPAPLKRGPQLSAFSRQPEKESDFAKPSHSPGGESAVWLKADR
jgi:high-affinity iron transporter